MLAQLKQRQAEDDLKLEEEKTRLKLMEAEMDVKVAAACVRTYNQIKGDALSVKKSFTALLSALSLPLSQWEIKDHLYIKTISALDVCAKDMLQRSLEPDISVECVTDAIPPVCIWRERTSVETQQTVPPQKEKQVRKFTKPFPMHSSVMLLQLLVLSHCSCHLTKNLRRRFSHMLFLIHRVIHPNVELNVTTRALQLKLSTMTAINTVIPSQSVCGLQVRGFYHENYLQLRQAYTREAHNVVNAKFTFLSPSSVTYHWSLFPMER